LLYPQQKIYIRLENKSFRQKFYKRQAKIYFLLKEEDNCFVEWLLVGSIRESKPKKNLFKKRIFSSRTTPHHHRGWTHLLEIIEKRASKRLNADGNLLLPIFLYSSSPYSSNILGKQYKKEIIGCRPAVGQFQLDGPYGSEFLSLFLFLLPKVSLFPKKGQVGRA